MCMPFIDFINSLPFVRTVGSLTSHNLIVLQDLLYICFLLLHGSIWGSGVTALPFLDFSTTWRWVISFTRRFGYTDLSLMQYETRALAQTEYNGSDRKQPSECSSVMPFKTLSLKNEILCCMFLHRRNFGMPHSVSVALFYLEDIAILPSENWILTAP
jgi:hypothetical protein